MHIYGLYVQYTYNVNYELYAIYGVHAIYNIYVTYIQYAIHILTIQNMSDMQYIQYGCKYVHHSACGNTSKMHKVLGAFLNISQISVLVLLLATFRTCNPAPSRTE